MNPHTRGQYLVNAEVGPYVEENTKICKVIIILLAATNCERYASNLRVLDTMYVTIDLCVQSFQLLVLSCRTDFCW